MENVVVKVEFENSVNIDWIKEEYNYGFIRSGSVEGKDLICENYLFIKEVVEKGGEGVYRLEIGSRGEVEEVDKVSNNNKFEEEYDMEELYGEFEEGEEYKEEFWFSGWNREDEYGVGVYEELGFMYFYYKEGG